MDGYNQKHFINEGGLKCKMIKRYFQIHEKTTTKVRFDLRINLCCSTTDYNHYSNNSNYVAWRNFFFLFFNLKQGDRTGKFIVSPSLLAKGV